MRSAVIKILLVEDNSGDARLVQLALSEVGGTQFDVTHVERLSQALQLLGGHAFDAILLDLSLPDSHGLDTVSQVEAADPSVPIVVLSGLVDEELAFEAVRSGAQDYLVKGRGDGYLMARAVRYAMQRKLSEDALRQSEKMLEEAQRITHVGNWFWDIATGEMMWSDEVYRIFGYRAQEFTPTYELFLATVVPEDRPAIVEFIDEAFRSGTLCDGPPYGLVHRITRPDGTVRTVEDRGAVERNEIGNPIRMLGTLQDITAYKQVEEALCEARDELEQRVEERTAHLAEVNRQLEHEIIHRKRTEEILRGERDFSSAVLDTVGALVVVLDREGRIIRFNRACEETTRYTFEEVQGLHIWELFIVPEEMDMVRRVFQELHGQQQPNKHENYWLTKHGERRLISWSNTMLPARNGAYAHVIATGIDITEQRKAEAHERQRLRELAHISRLSTMGEMATEIAHELNQPLAAIASYSDTCARIMSTPAWEPDDIRDVLAEIGVQAQRAGEIIRRLRNFARKEEGQRVPVDVNELVRDIVCLTDAEARWNEVGVFLELDESLPKLLADRILIEQVIMNLVRNAIDVLGNRPSGERRVMIQTWMNAEDRIEVTVKDTGPGLTPDVLERVFEPFFTTKPTGMGLGLSISQSIIEAHGGQLWATAEAGQGATFGFALPVVSVTEEADVV